MFRVIDFVSLDSRLESDKEERRRREGPQANSVLRTLLFSKSGLSIVVSRLGHFWRENTSS